VPLIQARIRYVLMDRCHDKGDKIVIFYRLKHSETKWWTRSIDETSEAILLLALLQSKSVALEGSFQSLHIDHNNSYYHR